MHTTLRTRAVVCLTSVITMFVLVDTARAGTYVMRTCNVPGETRTSVGPWNWDVGQGSFANNDCATGGGFGINAGAMPAGLAPGVHLISEPGIAIRRVRLWLVARLRGTGSSMFAETSSGSSTSSVPAVGLFGPPGGDTLSTPFVSALLSPDTRIYQVLVNCTADAGPNCTPADTNILEIKGAEVTLEESAPPTSTIDGGELLSRGPQSGVRPLAYTAVDQESGLARVSALIGNTVVGVVDYLPECPFADLAACQRGRNSAVFADTRRVPDGIYPVSLRVTDAAGNESTVQAPTAIQVANGAQAPLSPSSTTTPAPTLAGGVGLAAGVTLTASFAANRRSRITVGYGRRVVIRGRLIAQDGQPVAGARVGLQETPQSGTASARTAQLTTESDGVFAYTVPGGPSRTLTLSHAAAVNDAKPVVLRLRVKASASLRVRLDGVRVRYRGTVLSKPLPSRGKVVEIQGRAPGAAWKTFAVRRTTRRGAFSGTYRLRVHRPGVRLQFRVRIPAETGYPFVEHTGAPVTRLVR